MIFVFIFFVNLIGVSYSGPIEVNTFPLYIDDRKVAGHQVEGGNGLMTFFVEHGYMAMRVSTFNPPITYQRSLGFKPDDTDFSAIQMSETKILFLGMAKTFIFDVAKMKAEDGPKYKTTLATPPAPPAPAPGRGSPGGGSPGGGSPGGGSPGRGPPAAPAPASQFDQMVGRGTLVDGNDLLVCGGDGKDECQLLKNFKTTDSSKTFDNFKKLNNAMTKPTMFKVGGDKCIIDRSKLNCYDGTNWNDKSSSVPSATATRSAYPLVIPRPKSGNIIPLYIGSSNLPAPAPASAGGPAAPSVAVVLELTKVEADVTTPTSITWSVSSAAKYKHTQPFYLGNMEVVQGATDPTMMVGRATADKKVKVVKFDITKDTESSVENSTQIKLTSATRTVTFFAKTTRTEVDCLDSNEDKVKQSESPIRCEVKCGDFYKPQVPCKQPIGGSMCMCKNGTFRLVDAKKDDHLKCLNDVACAVEKDSSSVCTNTTATKCKNEDNLKCIMTSGLNCTNFRRLKCSVELCKCEAKFFDFTQSATEYQEVTACKSLDRSASCNSGSERYHDCAGHCDLTCRYHEHDRSCKKTCTSGCFCQDKHFRKYPGEKGACTQTCSCDTAKGEQATVAMDGGCEYRCRDKDVADRENLCASGGKTPRCICAPGLFRTDNLKKCVRYDECH